MLTDKCKIEFELVNPQYFALTQVVVNLCIWRWFNINTNIIVDIQNWDGKFDFAVAYKEADEVFCDITDAENRTTDFDANLQRAIIKANELFNLK